MWNCRLKGSQLPLYSEGLKFNKHEFIQDYHNITMMPYIVEGIFGEKKLKNIIGNFHQICLSPVSVIFVNDIQ